MFSERYIAVSKRPLIVPDKPIKRLIVGDKQRCLTCKRFALRIGKGSISNLQDRNKPYQHTDDCPQRGRF